MKCKECGETIGFYGNDSYGSIFIPWKAWCKRCWWEKHGWKEEDFMGLDEINESRINELAIRVENLERRKPSEGRK